MLRFATLVLVLAGCPGGGDECHVDSDCGHNLVCARNSDCLPASEVRSIRVTWTIRGMPANEMLCAKTPNFYLMFAGTSVNDTFGYEPVPCKAGLFSIDKLPLRFVSVELGVDGGFSEVTAFDAQGNASFDLAP
ncbi:MAG TPA: hypothetical protein VFV99_15350 [Kofleriaceae bacterium]|nr:hypothetical protein [Kofleriaceae bacterium]